MELFPKKGNKGNTYEVFTDHLVTYMTSYFIEKHTMGMRIETPPKEVQWLFNSN